MAEIPGWDDEIHASIKALVHLVGGRLDLMTTGDEGVGVRQLAAAYLARVRRLVMGIDVLYEQGMPDLVGALVRVCLEAWVTGMWVLFVGPDALDILSANHVFRSNQLIEAAELDLELLDEVENARNLPHIEKRTKVVETRLVDDGDALEKELLWSFRLVYGGESGAGIHAGLASVMGHLDEKPRWTGVFPERQEENDGSGKLLWVAPLLAMLARRVFIEFGIGVEDLDLVASPIQRLGVSLNEDAAPLPFQIAPNRTPGDRKATP
jgi:hypothetical protein